MPIKITGLFEPSGGAGAFDLYDPADMVAGLTGQVLTTVGGVPTWAAHNLLSATHGDTLAAAAVRGGTIVANSTPAWAIVTIGAAGSIWRSDGTDPAWTINPTIAGYMRVGATAAPANTTAGDHTCVRLAVGNVALPVGYVASINGALNVTANLLVGTDSLFVESTQDQVGIGTTAPSARLHVGGTYTGVNDILFAINTDFTPIGNPLVMAFYPTLRPVAGSANIVGLYFAPSIVVTTGLNPNFFGIEIVPTKSGAGTIADATAIVIRDYTFGASNMSLVSVGAGVQMRHRGSAVFGANVTPTANSRMDVRQVTAAATQTGLYLGHGTPEVVRQVVSFDPGAAGINFTAGQRVLIAA